MRKSTLILVWAFGGAAVPALAQTTGPLATTQAYPEARHGGNYMHNFYLPPAPSSTPWAPAWSPDGESIAVAMSGSIWRVDPETGVADELTSGPGYHSHPTWSPDGRFLVYTVDQNGATIGLGILELATGVSRMLTEAGFLYTDPVFSPDGNRLAWVSTKPSGYFNVYVGDFRDGALGPEEIAITRDENYGNDRLYFGPWDMHISPAWMPDSQELLLVSNHETPLGSGNVVRAPLAPDGFDEGVTVLEEQSLYRTRPDVSLDGKRFIYSSTAGAADQFSNLYVQPTVGGSPYKLTFFEHDAFHPRWSPDGEWIAYLDNAGGLPQLALLETYGGKRRVIEITRRNWRREMGVLTARTVDRATGEEMASRIHLRAADGRFYAPPDAFARIGGAGEHAFHQPGSFRLEVPVGTLEIEAVRGFEYEPVARSVEIEAGEVAALTLELPRVTDMAAKGWWSGSTHIHLNYGGNLHNTLENLMFMSDAEDQDVVLEQVANKDNRILDHQFFVPGGGAHPLSTDERILVVGQEYRPPFYGHVFYFGLEEHLISPYTTGYEGTAIESLYPSNTDMFRKARAQGATVGYVHAFFGERDPLVAPDGGPGDLGGAKGYMVDAALGTTDAVGVVRCLAGRVLPLVRDPEQRAPDHRGRRRGLDQQHAALQARRLGAHLCPHRRAGALARRLPRGDPRGPGLRELRPAARFPGRGPPAGRRDPAARLRRRGGMDRVGPLPDPARASVGRLGRGGCRRSSAGPGPPLGRRLRAHPLRRERLAAPPGRGLAGRAASARLRLRAGVHEPGLGERRRRTGPERRRRRVLAALDRPPPGAGRGVALVALGGGEGACPRAVRRGAGDLRGVPARSPRARPRVAPLPRPWRKSPGYRRGAQRRGGFPLPAKDGGANRGSDSPHLLLRSASHEPRRARLRDAVALRPGARDRRGPRGRPGAPPRCAHRERTPRSRNDRRRGPHPSG